MKIKSENQFGLNFTQEIKDHFFRLHSEKYFNPYPEEKIKKFKDQWLDILSDNGNKNLLFTKSSIEVANKIRLIKFEPKVLKIKNEKKLTFLIDDNHFYRVVLKQDEIFGMIIKKSPMGNSFYVSYDSFKIFPLQNIVHYPANQDGYLDDKYFNEFLKLLIFTEYSETEGIIN